jgi:hypothetical protein
MSIRYFDAGGATTTPAATGATETTVSNWAAPVVGGIIQRGLEIAGQPYQVYGGAQVAGSSDLQNKAFSGIQGLTQPNATQNNAATNMQNVYQSAMTQPGYAGTDFSKAGSALNQASYAGGQDYTSAGKAIGLPGYMSTDLTKIGVASNQNPYAGTMFTSNTTGINNQFGQDNLNQYMNPYLSTILNPQIEEARRQAQITQAQNNAKMTQAGAFGGGRQAILNAETQRNLGTNLADITGKGYNTAYTQALGQYNADQNRLMDALRAREQSSQFGYAKDAERLAGDRNALLEAAKTREQASQFGYAKNAERLAGDRTALLDSLRAKEQSNQYGYSKDAERLAGDRTALLDSLRAQEQSNQFGSNQGLNYLREAGNIAQSQGTFGNQQQQLGLSANKQQADLGAIQRDITQEGLTSDYNMWKEQRDYPKTQVDYLNNLIKQYPMTTTNTYGQAGNTAADMFGGMITAMSAYDILSGKKKP